MWRFAAWFDVPVLSVLCFVASVATHVISMLTVSVDFDSLIFGEVTAYKIWCYFGPPVHDNFAFTSC